MSSTANGITPFSRGRERTIYFGETPKCHHVSKLNRPQQALFLCVACGYANHADTVGGLNILARGLRERLNAYAAR